MLTNEWNIKSKRWGHPFHAMCSYMGMFPPRLPHYFIQKFTHRGDIVLDPFSGRGTTPLQACVEGRIGIGLDPNPLAYALTRAKVNCPDLAVLRNRLDDLSNDMFFGDVDREPPEIRMLFHDRTLSQLVYLKQVLDPADPTDAFLIAVLLGMLHGGAEGVKGPPLNPRAGIAKTFLSIPMPNTFSMSPGYIERYVREKGLSAPNLDVFFCLRARVEHMMRMGMPAARGRAWACRVQDMGTLADPALKSRQVRLVVTSPPYLKVLKYGLYNWIRLWFLDESPERLDAMLDQHPKMDDYLTFMNDTCRILYRVMAPGGVCAIVIGDVHGIPLAEEVWKHLKRKRTRFQLAQIIEDAVHASTKVTRIWGEGKKGRATSIDRVLVLYKDSCDELLEHVAW